MTREKIKEQVQNLIRSHDPRYDGSSDTAEKIMKIIETEFAFELMENSWGLPDYSTDDS
jgi:hypothetical protein